MRLMKILALAFAFSLFLLGAVFGNRHFFYGSRIVGNQDNRDVLSDQSAVNDSSGEDSDNSVSGQDRNKNVTPSVKPFPTLVTVSPAKPSSVPSNVNDINDWIYSQSLQVTRSDNNMTLKSTDDPKIITDWYKTKIKNLNMSVTSFVSTSSNGNILNKLAGAGNTNEVTIEIRKANVDSEVLILITLKK